jgi:leader peptidase (prepilin peptidase)/N-methyltransferase
MAFPVSMTEALHAMAWGNGSLATLEIVGRIVACVFLFAFGACVGSFLNVVVYRLPAGLSVVTPPSRCPTCGGRLSWKENLPVIGWLRLRGRCRFCAQPISIQYPLIEATIGVIFVLVYLFLYATPASADASSWSPAAWVLPWWKAQGFAWSWPLFVAILVMVAGLFAATVIDARHFIIPGEITWTVAGVGLAAACVQPFLPVTGRARMLEPPVYPIESVTAGVAIGGIVGLVVATLLVAKGIFPRSYADYHEHVKEANDFRAYPFARRETLKEMLFLAPPILGAILGGVIASLVVDQSEPLGRSLFGFVSTSLFGFLIGGATLWAVRVFGGMLFGKEAMGLGDVHLLAAVGAVLGWQAAVWTFILCLPLAIGFSILGLCLRPFIRLPFWELPLGPHLAMAAVLTFLGTKALRTLDPMLSEGFTNLWLATRDLLA